MPTLLPEKIRTEARRARRVPAMSSTDWLGLWSVSLGLAAVLLASLVYFGGRDSIGASFVLFGTAAIVALVIRAGANPNA